MCELRENWAVVGYYRNRDTAESEQELSAKCVSVAAGDTCALLALACCTAVKEIGGHRNVSLTILKGLLS